MTNLTSSIQVSEEMIAEFRGFFADETDYYIPSDMARKLCEKILAMRSKDHSIEPHPIPEVQSILASPTAIEKLKAMRVMCQSCRQGFYVEILDEVLTAIGSPGNGK